MAVYYRIKAPSQITQIAADNPAARGVELFEAAEDSVACARADQIVARVGYPAVEVWSHAEMIYRAQKPSGGRTRPIDSRSKKVPQEE